MRRLSWATKSYAVLGLAALLACVIVRAPTMLTKLKIPVLDVELEANAGYLLVFAPLLIVFALGIIMYLDSRRARREDRFGALIVRLVPCFAVAFLSLQFFLLLAPAGQCLTFPRWRYLIDWSLGAFQPEYCMGLPAEVQQRIPWLIEPPALEAWAQVVLPIVALGLVFADRARR